MPLFWLSLAFLSGIILASKVNLSIAGWSAFSVASLLLLLPPIYKHWSRFVPIRISVLTQQLKITSLRLFPGMLLFITMGGINYLARQPSINPSFIAYYNDQPGEFVVTGILAEPADERDSYTNLRVRVEQLSRMDDPITTSIHGLLLARTFPNVNLQYGDRIRLQGHIETPPENEDFSYREYLAHQGIYSYMPVPEVTRFEQGRGSPILSALYTFRMHALELVYRIFPDPEASLIAGIILGIQTGISPEVQEAFRMTGTSHIIVISGFNITIIAGMFTYLFKRWLGRYKGAVVTLIGIIFYTLLVGANAAVVRAAVLGMLTLLGHLIGRRQAGVNSLAFVGGVMALITPTVLWDISFQLSFAATLGIMLYAEPFSQWFVRAVSHFISPEKAESLAGPISEYFLLTLAAQLTTLPLMAYYFKRLSLTALIANPMILPAQPALMVLGGLAILAGIAFQPIGQILAWVAWPFTAYTIRMVEWLAKIPHGTITLGQVALPLILIFYIILLGITCAHAQLPHLGGRLRPVIPLTLLGALTVMIWRAAFYAPDGRLHVTVLDVSTGEGVLIQSATGRNVLINGGPSTIALSDALGRRLPPFNRSLDWLVIGDIDSEDISGISANLERFPPKKVLWAGNTSGTRPVAELQTQLISLKIPTTTIEAGQVLDLGLGASLQVVSTNTLGAVLLLEWENFRMLLPMGVNFSSLESLQHNSAMRSVSAVVLLESGYAPLNPPYLISLLHPQLALLSVAAGDKTGLPSPETLEALEGYNLLRTDTNGWIEITTDGKQMWVEVERR